MNRPAVKARRNLPIAACIRRTPGSGRCPHQIFRTCCGHCGCRPETGTVLGRDDFAVRRLGGDSSPKPIRRTSRSDRRLQIRQIMWNYRSPKLGSHCLYFLPAIPPSISTVKSVSETRSMRSRKSRIRRARGCVRWTALLATFGAACAPARNRLPEVSIARWRFGSVGANFLDSTAAAFCSRRAGSLTARHRRASRRAEVLGTSH